MQDSLQTFKNLTVMFYLDDWSVLLLYTAKLEMNHSFTILCFKQAAQGVQETGGENFIFSQEFSSGNDMS